MDLKKMTQLRGGSLRTWEFVIYVNDSKSNADGQFGLDDALFGNHESVAIYVSKLCDGGTMADEPEDLQYFAEKYGTPSFNLSLLGASIEELMEPVKNPHHLDGILRTPPVLFVGDKVIVKIGLQIQAMSNFELSTMDYDVDTWLRMAWYDPRLRHGSSRPILVNEFRFLKKIWRPDPIFTNAKSATFQKKPSRSVFGKKVRTKDSTRVGFTSDAVEFEWFSEPSDAIQLNRDLEIPELTLVDVKAETCDGSRKS
ncbi:hypothetical protein TELCIR_16119, partial [Teladorsagia circumcincta]